MSLLSFVILFSVGLILTLGATGIFQSRLSDWARRMIYVVVCLLIFGILIVGLPAAGNKGLPITKLENGQVYIAHFDYTNWDNPDPNTPMFLELAKMPGEEPLHYQIPRYQLMNSEDEPFIDGQRIYPAFRVKKTENTAKENIYILEPVASSFPIQPIQLFSDGK